MASKGVWGTLAVRCTTYHVTRTSDMTAVSQVLHKRAGSKRRANLSCREEQQGLSFTFLVECAAHKQPQADPSFMQVDPEPRS